jgi:hypothetical protein
MIFALNLNVAMKRLVLQENWVSRRMKAIRFHQVNIAGRIISSGRQFKLRVGCGRIPEDSTATTTRKELHDSAFSAEARIRWGILGPHLP